jgi:hypothetical protein
MGFLTNYVSSRTRLSFISFHHTMNICNVGAVHAITTHSPTHRPMIMHIRKSRLVFTSLKQDLSIFLIKLCEILY